MSKKRITKKISNIDEKILSIVVFSLFFSWLLAFPFEGQVLYALTERFGIEAQSMVFGAIAAHFCGLISCGFFIKTMKTVKRVMIFSIIICIAGSIPFFFTPSIIWHISIISCSFMTGVCIAAWGFYFKIYTPSNNRIKTAADLLIYSNILMVIINATAINISPYAGLALSIIMLIGSLFFMVRMPGDVKTSDENYIDGITISVSPAKPFCFLCFFIVIITINSGLMYQVVNPAFAHHKLLVSWYWAVPYIIALYIIKNLREKTNRNYILYVAIAMIGFSFIAFILLDRSVLSYLIINTLMLGACGIYDLFWWSILGEMLDYHDNPAKILGIGLSANVLGIFIGGMLGNSIASSDTIYYNSSMLALSVVLITLIMLPLLHKHLSMLLKNHVFLMTLYEMAPSKQKDTIESFSMIGNLTERESEITALLLKGRTYKMIANEVYLSENTVKTHIKNIYSKFNVQSKVELINLLMEKEN
ncbi:helix-turn-helix transcriptional regulator [Lutispora sp.]|nr:helix-turn-helix transcriptional regulator [Lutispora sp.]MEA4960770.1 helix-turn-helix transcriptional regulator [Lutispora sp.]HCJ56927.1 helix-turn-helix transcriptional regulator [Clostridiaceae bacterium]